MCYSRCWMERNRAARRRFASRHLRIRAFLADDGALVRLVPLGDLPPIRRLRFAAGARVAPLPAAATRGEERGRDVLLEVLDGKESRVRQPLFASRTSDSAHFLQMTAPSFALCPFELLQQDVVFVLQPGHA